MANGAAINSQESLDRTQAAPEACWLGLRRNDGINRHAFQQRFGVDVWEHFKPQLQAWKNDDKLLVYDDSILLSGSGIALADAISASVLFV